MKYLLRKNFLWNLSFCDFQTDVKPKSAFSIDFLYVITPFSPKIKGLHLPFSSHSENLWLYQSTELKNWWFSVLHYNPDCPNIPKSVIVIDKSRYSNSFFFRDNWIVYFHQGRNQKSAASGREFDYKTILSNCQVPVRPEYTKRAFNFDVSCF